MWYICVSKSECYGCLNPAVSAQYRCKQYALHLAPAQAAAGRDEGGGGGLQLPALRQPRPRQPQWGGDGQEQRELLRGDCHGQVRQARADSR